MQLKEIKNSNEYYFIHRGWVNFQWEGASCCFHSTWMCVSGCKYKQTADEEYEDEVCADLWPLLEDHHSLSHWSGSGFSAADSLAASAEVGVVDLSVRSLQGAPGGLRMKISETWLSSQLDRSQILPELPVWAGKTEHRTIRSCKSFRLSSHVSRTSEAWWGRRASCQSPDRHACLPAFFQFIPQTWRLINWSLWEVSQSRFRVVFSVLELLLCWAVVVLLLLLLCCCVTLADRHLVVFGGC